MKTITVKRFEEGLKKSSPVPISNEQKKTKTSYDYFRLLGSIFTKSLSENKSPFLPDRKGFIDLHPAYNIYTNEKLEGITQIMLQEKKAELNAKESGFVTFETIKKAQDAGVDCKIIKGSKGIVIPVVDDKDWSIMKFKNTWFNINQIENKENLLEFCKDCMTEKFVQNQKFSRENYPSNYSKQKNPATFVFDKPNEKYVLFNSQNSKPYQYIAQILNASLSGRKVLLPLEIANDFKTQTIKLLTAEYKEGKLDVCAIKKLSDSVKLEMKKLKEMYVQKKKEIKKFTYKRERLY